MPGEDHPENRRPSQSPCRIKRHDRNGNGITEFCGMSHHKPAGHPAETMCTTSLRGELPEDFPAPFSHACQSKSTRSCPITPFPDNRCSIHALRMSMHAIGHCACCQEFLPMKTNGVLARCFEQSSAPKEPRRSGGEDLHRATTCAAKLSADPRTGNRILKHERPGSPPLGSAPAFLAQLGFTRADRFSNHRAVCPSR